MRTNLRWCSDGFEFACWNGDIVRGLVIIDAYVREVMAWCAVVNAGIGGSVLRGTILAALEVGFGGRRAPHQADMLIDIGLATDAVSLPANPA